MNLEDYIKLVDETKSMTLIAHINFYETEIRNKVNLTPLSDDDYYNLKNEFIDDYADYDFDAVKIGDTVYEIDDEETYKELYAYANDKRYKLRLVIMGRNDSLTDEQEKAKKKSKFIM